MFEYNEVVNYLSASAKARLADANLYAGYAVQAEIILNQASGVDISTKPAWALIPFVRVLDYLILNTLTGMSDQYIAVVTNNYKEAIKTAKNNTQTDALAIDSVSVTNSRIGPILGDYDVNI